MEIRNIVTFIRVAELKSFTKAATLLGYSQAAITVQIKQLEQELGTQLFDRVGKTVKLTVSGEKFMPYASALLKASDDAVNFMNRDEGVSGILRIGASSSVSASIMPVVFREFNKLFPNVRIVVKTSDLVDVMYEQLRQNEIDLMFVLEKRGAYSDCNTLFAHEEEIVLVTNANNPLLKEKNITVDRIIKEPFITTSSEASYCHCHEQMIAELGYKFKPVMEIGSTSAIVNILSESNCVAILPKFVANIPVAEGKLAIIDSYPLKFELCTQMLCYRNKWINPQMQAFIDFMDEHFATIIQH